MVRHRCIAAVMVGALTLSGLTACEQLPGGRREQATVGGAAAGAAAGAVLAGSEHRGLGALIGGAIGAGGGYLIAANWDKLTGEEREDAVRAEQQAREEPATAADVRLADTADLNNDGFVTLDEVVAMHEAGLSNQEMIRRLEATDQYFELTEQQEQYLRERGVSNDVIVAMRDIEESSARLASERLGEEPIGRPRE